MSQKYNNKLASFCPEGKLMQIEYAMESIRKGNTVVAIRVKTGIALATDKMTSFGLNRNDRYANHVFLLDDHIFCTTTGFVSDIHVLVNYARLQSQTYKRIYQDSIPIKRLVDVLCSIKQKFTQTGEKRPYGSSLLISGWDSLNGFQLFRTDPSGNYSKWKAIALGFDSIHNQSVLSKEIYGCDTLYKAVGILIKIFSKKFTTSNLYRFIDVIVIEKDDANNMLYYRFSSSELKSFVPKNIDIV